MNRKTLHTMKKMMAGVMATALVVSGMIVMPKTVEAAERTDVYEDKIVYEDKDLDNTAYNITEYWSKDSKKVPTKAGYFFGGWYVAGAEAGTYEALSEEDAAKATSDTSVYAKFVPSYVMSVKAQNEAGTKKGDDVVNAEDDSKSDYTSLRVVSAVDSDDYQKVGFKILLNNDPNNDLGTLETTKGYTGLKVSGQENPVTPQQLFGQQAAYMMVWRLDGIKDAQDAKIINVTPYWITKDGTKVEGLTKYVHVEDGYEKYVNIPINLCDNPVMMAAGLLSITYDNAVLTLKDVEYGVFDEDKMEYSDKGDSIKFVGNAAEVNKNIAADGIYANLRFSIKEGSTYEGAGTGNFLTFEVNGEQFCDWDEDLVDVDAWDIQY